MMSRFLIGLIIVLGGVLVFSLAPNGSNPLPDDTLRIGNTAIHVEIADTRVKWEQGLSGRESLAEGEGMLFIFDEPAVYGFWMKDMRFPLDIVWIDSDKRITGIEKDILPETYPEIFRPNGAVKYVLEIPAGFSQRHEIDIGDEVFFAD